MSEYIGTLKIVIPNKYVACKPYLIVESKGGVFSSWQVKNPLVELEVVYPDKENEYVPGSNVYVRPFLEQPSWIRDVFTLNGKEVILVPKDFIVGYKYVEEEKISLPTVNPWFQPTQPYWNGQGVIGAASGAGGSTGTITLPYTSPGASYTVTLLNGQTWCSATTNVANSSSNIITSGYITSSLNAQTGMQSV